MAIISPKLTYEHLRQLPDDGKRYEIVDGELLVSPSPNHSHQRTVLKFAIFLQRAEDAGYGEVNIAPFDVFFDEHNVTEPDVLFVRKERIGIIGPNFVNGAPDIIVEVLSPGTRHRDEGVKLRLYGGAGARYYWMPDPAERVIYRYELTPEGFREQPALKEGDVLECPLFPGITTDVAKLFG